MTGAGSVTTVFSGEWSFPRHSYSILLRMIKEKAGGWSAVALNLPGAGSCGATKAEAKANAIEAIRAVLRSHIDAGESIPFVKPGHSRYAKRVTVSLDEGE